MDDAVTANSAGAELTPVVTPPRQPRVWTVFLALLAAVVMQVAFAGIIVLLTIAVSGDPGQAAKELPEKLGSPGMFMLLVSSSEVAFAIAAIGAAWLSPLPFRKRLGLLPARPSWLVYPLAALGSWAVLAVGIGLAVALTLVLPADEGVEKLIESITLAQAVPFVLLIAVPPGICEELMFRGYVQQRLVERWRPGWAIAATSLLFALVHVQPHTVVVALPLGLWFGFVTWRSGSIFPAMLCHAFVNGSLNAWRMVAKFAEVPEAAQIVVMAASAIVGVVCFFLAANLFAPKEREGSAAGAAEMARFGD